jgi:hypothetical protein
MAKSLKGLYECDFFEWTARTAELLRHGDIHQIDREHVAEEIEDMGKRDRREAISKTAVLIAHLLKWCIQPEQRQYAAASWLETIHRERREIPLICEDSPSLERFIRENLDGRIYRLALRIAAEDTGIDLKRFPKACPFTFEQVLDSGFLP